MGLRKLRKAKGYTLYKLEELSGVNYSKIYKIEAGIIDVEHIMLRTAVKLARALECKPEDLLEPDEETGNAN